MLYKDRIDISEGIDIKRLVIHSNKTFAIIISFLM